MSEIDVLDSKFSNKKVGKKIHENSYFILYKNTFHAKFREMGNKTAVFVVCPE